jgi:hypothetical protein
MYGFTRKAHGGLQTLRTLQEQCQAIEQIVDTIQKIADEIEKRGLENEHT